METEDKPLISFCIVNLNAARYLRDCLLALPRSVEPLPYEVIVVDNGSSDGSAAMLQQEFPDVLLICNPENWGYTRPMNQALRAARGRFLVQLNPDTLPQPGLFPRLVDFMHQNPQAGILTPKVLNSDGTLQYQCRRSAARAWDTISYFSGLSRLFPRSPFFSRYLMTYLKEDETAEVEAVSGSCMLIRREVTGQIGFLDEQFFAYQEDADFCFRARAAGWKIFYVPQAEIIHYGGMGGSRAEPVRGIIAWHRSYYLYYRKHLARGTFFLVNWLMYAAMGLKLAFSLAASALRREKVVGTPKPGL